MRYRSPVILAIAALVGAVGAAAQESRDIDPYAADVLQQASTYLAGLSHFTFRAEVREDEWSDAGLIELGRTVSLAVRRPDRMWADASGDDGHKRYWFDGSAFTLMDYGFGTYARAVVPGSIDNMLETMQERYGVMMPLADLAFSDLYETLMANVTSAAYVGMQTIHGVEYHHLAFSQEAIDWQLWVENGPRPLPARLLITYTQEDGSPRFAATLSRWDTASPVPDALFDFVPPPGASEIAFVSAGGDRR